MVLTEKSQEFKLFRPGLNGVNRLNQGNIDFLATKKMTKKSELSIWIFQSYQVMSVFELECMSLLVACVDPVIS